MEVQKAIRLAADSEVLVTGTPYFVGSDAQGRIFLIRSSRLGLPEAPPLVFDHNGRFLTELGRRGRGPGETLYPSWIDFGPDDSIRVFEASRIHVFGPDLHPARTQLDLREVRSLRYVVRFGDGMIVGLGNEFLKPGEPRPVHELRPGVKSLTMMPEPALKVPNGPVRVLAASRNPHRFWIGQFDLSEGVGYDLLLTDPGGHVFAAFRRRPVWWKSPRIIGLKTFVPTSRVQAVREIRNGLLLVLVAQPRSDWKPGTADPRNLMASSDAYEARMELVDVVQRGVSGWAHVPGYPVGIVDDTTIATYVEDADGSPHVDLWRAYPTDGRSQGTSPPVRGTPPLRQFDESKPADAPPTSAGIARRTPVSCYFASSFLPAFRLSQLRIVLNTRK